MLTKTFATIDASGENFSPTKWEASAKIVCSSKRERGELGSNGRFKGLPFPEGSGSYDLVKDCENENDIYSGSNDEFWATVIRVVTAAKTLNAEYVELSMTIFYKDQCNLWFDAEAIARLYSLGVPLGISCVEDKDAGE
jgi:hypothetical protein